MQSGVDEMEMTTMNNGAESINRSFSNDNIQVNESENVDSIANVNNIKSTHNDVNNQITRYTITQRIKCCCFSLTLYPVAIRVLSFCMFTAMAMIIGTLVVCFTLAKPPDHSCHLVFQTLIHEHLVQHNSKPSAIKSGDLNNDTFIDLIVANSDTNTIGIFLNDGNGNFLPQILLNTGHNSRPYSIIVDDFNNDIHLDIISANYDSHNIGLFINNGNNYFKEQITFSTGIHQPISLATNDLNKDGYLDIVVVYNKTDCIGIFYGNENEYFQNQIIYSTSYDSHPSSAIIADFNNDNYLDIAITNFGTNNICIFYGCENNNLSKKEFIYSTGLLSKPSSIVVNDLNKDQYLDIIVSHYGTNSLGIFLGYGNKSFSKQIIYSILPGLHPQSIDIGDFNQDNQIDIVTCNSMTNNIAILIGYGNGSFSSPTIFSTSNNSYLEGIVVNDFDNNNQSDIAVIDSMRNNIFVFIGYYLMQSNNPKITYSFDNSAYLRQLSSGDLNNDTFIDLVVANSAEDKIHILFSYGNGSFQSQIEYSTGNPSHPIPVIVYDIDQDMNLDILVGNAYAQSIGIFYGFGNGSFSSIINYFTGISSSVIWISVNNCNNDNYLDIFYADRYSDSIGILLGNQNRTFQYPIRYSCGLGSTPLSIVNGDFNHDGQLDLATIGFSNGYLIIFLGYGNGSFTLFSKYSVGDNCSPFMLTTIDLNKDNYLDILVGISNVNYFDIFYGFGNGSFDKPLRYSTGIKSQPLWIDVIDINNDCSLDIIVSNSNNNNIGIFLGNNSKYFNNQTIYNTGLNSIPYTIIIHDFNQDNQYDIAIMNTGTSQIAILLGHPTLNSSLLQMNCINQNYLPILLGDYYTNFSSIKTYSTGSSSKPLSLAIADLNNDKQMDIIVANSGNENLAIFFGYNYGYFKNEIIISLYNSAHPQNIIIYDFNKDNLLDIAITDSINDQIILLLGNDNETFSTQLIYSTGLGSNPHQLTIADLNNDNYIDLIVTNTGTDSIGIFYGFSYISFKENNLYETGQNSNPKSLAIGDFNNDNHLDIVSALYGTNNLALFLGFGNGTFTSMILFAYIPAANYHQLDIGDFNNDNNLDIAVTNYAINSISIILGYGNGSFQTPVIYSTGNGSRPNVIDIGYINNDSYLDIVINNYGTDTISLFFGKGDGTFENDIRISAEIGSGANYIVIVDVNNDTYQDLLTANYGSHTIGIFLGYGNKNFAEQMTFSTGPHTSPLSLALADFNHDGYLDIVNTNYATDNIGIFYGYGNGSFKYIQSYSCGHDSEPRIVFVDDFNNDNILDIVVSTTNIGTISILLGYNDGTFANYYSISPNKDSATYGMVISDFNNDNYLDIASGDYNNGYIRVFLSSNRIPFGGQKTFFLGQNTNPISLAIGYLNNDIYLDIAVVNSNTNTLGLIFQYGNRTLSNMIIYSTGFDSNPISLAIADFNNDSQIDIVVANFKTNQIIIFYGYNYGNYSYSIIYQLSIGSQPISIAVSYFNIDNYLDIIVANYGTNNICIFFGFQNNTFINERCYPLKYNARPTNIILKDLNNDTRDDIIVTLYGTDNVNILLNTC